MAEGVEMRFMDDPMHMTRVYMFKVSIPQWALLKKYVAFWLVVKYMWKMVRYGK